MIYFNLSTFDNIKQYQNFIWPYLTIYDYIWQYLTIYDYIWQYLTIYDYIWQYRTQYIKGKYLQKDPSMHDKLLLFSKFLISPRLTERESRAICRGAFAPKNHLEYALFKTRTLNLRRNSEPYPGTRPANIKQPVLASK